MKHIGFPRIIFLLLLVSMVLPVEAEGNDFALDFTADANKKLLDNRLAIGLSANARTQDYTSQMDGYALELSGVYKLIDRKRYGLKVGLAYEHSWAKHLDECEFKYKTKYESDKFNYVGNGQFEPIVKGFNEGYNYDAAYWRNRSRISLSMSFSYKPAKRLTLTLKETIQYKHYYEATTERTKYRHKVRYDEGATDYIETYMKEKRVKNRWMLRSKLTLQYSRKRCPWEPYVSADFGCGLSYTNYKWKLTAGTDYKISKQHTLNAFYRFQTEHDDDALNLNIIGVGYSFKF